MTKRIVLLSLIIASCVAGWYNLGMLEVGQEKLEANGWVITARWYYIIGIFLFFLVSKIGEFNPVSFPFQVMFGLLLLGFLFNLLFWLSKRNIKASKNYIEIRNLGLAQTGIELVFFAVIVHLSGGVESVATALFFIPIVAAILLFDSRGPLLTAIGATLTVNLLVLFEYGGILRRLGDYFGISFFPFTNWTEAWIKTALVSLAYIIVGLFSAYTAKLIRERNELLADKLAEEKQKIKDIERLNQELTDYAKELFDKDFELTLANKRLQMLEAAKSKFVSVTTHQLRTPLAAIKWTFHMILQEGLGKVNDEQREFLQKGFDSTQRIIAIVNDLLNIDYIEANKLDYRFVPSHLDTLVDGLIFEFTNHAESKKIKLELVKPNHALPEVMLDPIKISMVLENLIDNAIKYSRPGGNVRVKLSDERVNSAQPGLEVSVSDSGIGIPATEQEKIFHRFFRASNAVKESPDGSGLGLFISRDIIQKHGGQMWFDSKEGKGTDFHFSLPIQQNKNKV
mgnify:CR=1 FL=1